MEIRDALRSAVEKWEIAEPPGTPLSLTDSLSVGKVFMKFLPRLVVYSR
jgi:hypothetical protein